MKARDVMTSPVITVGPDTSVRRIAALLLEHRVSALPVLAKGRLVGIVSEADLLRRHEIGTDGIAQGSWWLRLFSHDTSLEDYIKSHARRARDVMTREVVTVAPDTPLAAVADLLHRRGVKRVPVVEHGQLVGILSRSNLVRALAEQHSEKVAAALSDAEIRKRLLAELRDQSWWRRGHSYLSVRHGVVVYSGTVESAEERDAARVAAENVPGVRRVEDRRLVFRDLPSMI